MKKAISLVLALAFLLALIPGVSSNLLVSGNVEPATEKVTFNGRQYQLFDAGMSWTEAKAYCESLGGYLATITNEDEQKFITNLLRNGGKAYFWLGGYRVNGNNFAWVTGEPMTYTNWDPEEPNNYTGDENYIVINWIGGWNDLYNEGFASDMGFICEWGIVPATEKITFNGRQYQVFDAGMSWTEAKAYCESLGGYLATITDSAEQRFIESLLMNGGKDTYWLGGYRVNGNNFAWITGEPMAYTNWDPEEPNNYTGDENYIVINWIGGWNDLYDGGFGGYGSEMGFICEWGKYDKEEEDEEDDEEDEDEEFDEVTIPRDTFKLDAITSLTIETSLANFTFDRTAIRTIADAGEGDITIGVGVSRRPCNWNESPI